MSVPATTGRLLSAVCGHQPCHPLLRTATNAAPVSVWAWALGPAPPAAVLPALATRASITRDCLLDNNDQRRAAPGFGFPAQVGRVPIEGLPIVRLTDSDSSPVNLSAANEQSA